MRRSGVRESEVEWEGEGRRKEKRGGVRRGVRGGVRVGRGSEGWNEGEGWSGK